MVDPGHGEGSPQTDGVSLEGRFPGSENVMLETGRLLPLLQHHQATPASTVMAGNNRGLEVLVASREIFSPAGHAVAEPVVFLGDHQVLLVLHPGGTAGGAGGVGVGTDVYPAQPGSGGPHWDQGTTAGQE